MAMPEPDNSHFEKFLDERFARVSDQIGALKELVVQRADAGDKALDVAKTGLNEMRGMAADQATMFLPRAEFEGKHESTTTRLTAVEADVILMRGAEKGSDKLWYIVFSVAMFLVAAATILYRTAH